MDLKNLNVVQKIATVIGGAFGILVSGKDVAPSQYGLDHLDEIGERHQRVAVAKDIESLFEERKMITNSLKGTMQSEIKEVDGGFVSRELARRNAAESKNNGIVGPA